MTANEQLDRLSRRVASQSLGPVTVISDQVLAYLTSSLQVFTAWLRQAARDRPLISLLLSIEAGYVFARIGRRHARR
jgi:uncharacterized membrane protein